MATSIAEVTPCFASFDSVMWLPFDLFAMARAHCEGAIGSVNNWDEDGE